MPSTYDSMRNATYATISKTIEFDAGHRVPLHNGKCRNPHGHRYKVVVECYGAIIDDPGRSDNGMLVDFGDLKRILMEEVHDVLDHTFIVWEKDELMIQVLHALINKDVLLDDEAAIVFPYVPTAENIARWIWEQIDPLISEHFNEDLYLYRVTVYETPTSEASYRG